MTEWIAKIDKALWGWPLILLLFGTHIFMTFRTGFIQKDVFKAIKMSFEKDEDAEGDVSQFAALTTALSSTIGTGNIIGVGTAIALGGPGAVFWMWLTGVFGMATKYAETIIAVKYRVKSNDGSMIGGAMYALERGLHMRWAAILFAVFTVCASFGIGCMVQSNAISSSLQNTFSFSPVLIGGILVILVGMVIFGGVQSISKVSEKLVPFMALFYVGGCFFILLMNRAVLWESVVLILKSAFAKRALSGGFVGSTIATACRYGFARGLFSNESGMGSGALVASAAKTRNPKRQALVSMTATFWDTVVICLLSGLVLVSTIVKYPAINALSDNGGTLTSQAFSMIPHIGQPVLMIGLMTFAFSTILGWYYYGERCLIYLFGQKSVRFYQVLFMVGVFVGALTQLNVVWNLSDILNGLMAVPNLFSVWMLQKVIVRETKKYGGDHIHDEDQTEIPLLENEHGVLRKH